MTLRKDFSPNRIILSRQVSFVVLTNPSEQEFRLGLFNGVFNGVTPEFFIIVSNCLVYFEPRSWIRYFASSSSPSQPVGKIPGNLRHPVTIWMIRNTLIARFHQRSSDVQVFAELSTSQISSQPVCDAILKAFPGTRSYCKFPGYHKKRV